MGFGRVFLTIFVLALVEVMVLAAVADFIGWPITILMVVVTALLGTALFRSQGLQTWQRLNQRMNQGEMPGRELAEGMMLLLGGAFLITPGFITDALGFALLLPFSRRAMADYLIRKGTLQTFATRGGPGGGAFFYQSRTVYPGGSRPGQSGPGPANDPAHRPGSGERPGVTIEGEADEPDEPRR
ncbi:MAG: FxsA family protein [Pseudomonadota bacterium]|jgi:UPF0716 protein FxsA|uniref:FxsA family protein n=1 Tax=Alloalcanivorax venustensis TaxID=172371 RepID=UPI002EAEB8D4|nr:FxsA family protein [Pseudomonadota bacterium]